MRDRRDEIAGAFAFAFGIFVVLYCSLAAPETYTHPDNYLQITEETP